MGGFNYFWNLLRNKWQPYPYAATRWDSTVAENGFANLLVPNDNQILYLTAVGCTLNNKSGAAAVAHFGIRDSLNAWKIFFVTGSWRTNIEHTRSISFPVPMPMRSSLGYKLSGYSNLANCQMYFWGVGWEMNETME